MATGRVEVRITADTTMLERQLGWAQIWLYVLRLALHMKKAPERMERHFEMLDNDEEG